MSLFSTALLALGALGVFASSVSAQDADLERRLEAIRAYTRISDDLASAGQIAYDQIPLLADAGFDVVINLAPADPERNAEEGFRVVEQGLSYIHIPVSWEAPSQRDLQLFFDVMAANADRKVFVHCFANMRASAFVYLYRTLIEGTGDAGARADMARVWDPADREQWGAFVEEAQHLHQ